MFVCSPGRAVAVASALMTMSCTVMTENSPATDATLFEQRVDALMAQLTLEEKVSLLAGETSMTLHAVPRLGIPKIGMTDGPTGVRSPEGHPATVFPVGVAIAATWNPELAGEVGAAIAEEARGYRASVLLAPTVNIVRTPRWGRNFETYSEDPHLAGQMGLGYARGVQSRGVGVSLKHFAANNQETNRFSVDSVVDERTMREIYLPAFETVVKQADPWSVMASYNKVNGTYAAESPWLLTDVLKREWGYKGFVVSDWGATHSGASAVKAGLDLEMPGPPNHFGDKLLAAAKSDPATATAVDDSARRMVRLAVRSGLMDGPAPKGEIGGERHEAIARRAAEEAIVLLKNDGALPLDPGIRTLAVIGPNAAIVRIQGGGSSAVQPFEALQTPLDALRAAFPHAQITYERGVDNEETPPPALAEDFSPTRDRKEAGLTATYFATRDGAGPPVKSERATDFQKRISGNIAGPQATGYASLKWEGFFWPSASGHYEFSVRGTGTATLSLDGRVILDKSAASTPDNRDVIGFPVPRRTVGVDLEAGRPYPIKLDYATGDTPYEALTFGVRAPRPNFDAAIAAARSADAAIVVVGSGSMTEGEGYDRANIDLPGDQDRLVTAIVAANPKTVVIVNAGAAMTMPWKSAVPAIVDMWLPGERGPAALADIVTGKVNPSGKLPVTFPAKSSDDTVDLVSRKSAYSEGLLVGYRGYDAHGVEPLFPFGHGLSYTSFAYSDVTAPASAKGGGAVTVSVKVRNTGKRAGKEVVQAYVAPAMRTSNEPVKQLRAFAKVELAAGETKTVTLTLPPRAFAGYDVDTHAWVVKPGDYHIDIGSSSRDIRGGASIRLTTGGVVP